MQHAPDVTHGTMTKLRLALFVAVALGPTWAHAQAVDDAYLDPTARALVQGARARRATVDLSIDEYRTISTDRFSLKHRLLGRERLLMRRETATRVHWRREGDIDLEVVGARDGSGFLGESTEVPGDLDDYLHVAFDPLEPEFLVRLDSTFIRHPFAPGAEAHYRFSTGDSSTIRLPDGTGVRLREVRVIPRRPDPQLVTGSFWLDAESHAIVRATFRPVTEYRFGVSKTTHGRAVGVGRAAQVKTPFFLRGVRAELTRITLEYGFWELRWWLPRYVRIAGVLEAGRLGNLSLEYELSYGDYSVTGDTSRVGSGVDTTAPSCYHVRGARDVVVLSGPDSVRAAWEQKAAVRRKWRQERPDTAAERCLRVYRVSAPATADSLLHSAFLPPSIYAPSELQSPMSAEELAGILKDIPGSPWQLSGARLDWARLRYNRVEGLSPGVGQTLDLGRGEAGAELRYGLADQTPKGRWHFTMRAPTRTYHLLGYRDLRPVEPEASCLGLGASLWSFLWGHEDAFYYRALGGSLEFSPPAASPTAYSLRLYAERQRPVQNNTNFSMAHLFDSDVRFRQNITADPASQLGAELMLQTDWGENPESFRLGTRVRLRAETGSYRFLRPELTLRLNAPAVGPLALSLEGAAGTTLGESPSQSLWYLGGARTLRGYRPGDTFGEAYWRGRAELGAGIPTIRISAFSDLGWAGSGAGTTWRDARPLWSVGLGVSLFDGILRLDLGRALRAPTGWHLESYLGGVH